MKSTEAEKTEREITMSKSSQAASSTLECSTWSLLAVLGRCINREREIKRGGEEEEQANSTAFSSKLLNEGNNSIWMRMSFSPLNSMFKARSTEVTNRRPHCVGSRTMRNSCSYSPMKAVLTARRPSCPHPYIVNV